MRLRLSPTKVFFLLTWSFSSWGANKPPPTDPEKLPFGVFPSVHTIIESPHEAENLKAEIKDLSKRVESTVKIFSTRRNITCFDSPCLIQAFPLLYNSAGSGFFGGVRANITNISRTNPNLYSLDASIVRSDTKQWLTSLAIDLPKIEEIPGKPRLKVRTFYSRSTENRFFGIGPEAIRSETLPDDVVRYSLKEIGYQSSIVVPVAKVISDWQFSVFGLLSSIRNRPARLDESIPSKLFNEHPLGAYEGGTSSRLGIGFLLDNRDRELFSREGWALETSIEFADPPILGQYHFRRYSAIDRHYLSWERYTFASRLSFDLLEGEVPFWELSGIGGIDPIRDVSGPYLLRAYGYGRFHEKQKILWSIDHRYYLSPTRKFGMLWETMLIPLGIDVGRLGEQTAWSLSTGANFLLNKNFLIRLLAGYSPNGTHYRIAFGQEY